MTTAGLIVKTGKAYEAELKSQTERLGVTGTYRALLCELMRGDGGTQLDLVKKTGMKAPTVSIALRGMERSGMVRRESDEEDLRKTHVYLTERGRLMYKYTGELSDTVENKYLRALSEAEKQLLHSLLLKIQTGI